MVDNHNDPTLKWDLSVVFPNDQAFDRALENLRARLDELHVYERQLNSAETLWKYLELNNELSVEFGKLRVYAGLTRQSNNADVRGQQLQDRTQTLGSQYQAATSFSHSEILSLGSEKLQQFITEYPKLERYRFYLEEMEKNRPHTPPAEVEKLVAQAHKALHNYDDTFDMLVEADQKYGDAIDSKEVHHPVTTGNVEQYLNSADRELRRSAFESFADAYYGHRNTLAMTFRGVCLTNHFDAVVVRKHASALAAKCFVNDHDTDVYFTTVNTCREQKAVWQRYFNLKARYLGVEKVSEYDIHAPLSQNPVRMDYKRGREAVIESLAPLGDAYVAEARAGMYEGQWVDVYPRPGKSSNAFSSGSYATPPFILMNYSDAVTEVGTLAHELGHSMHSQLAKRRQPPVYADYSMIIAETASNFNQGLLRNHLLKSNDRDLILSVLDETFANFHRYTFLFPVLSQLEHESHEAVRNDQPLTADWLCKRCTELYSEAYGDSVDIDPQRLSMRWAQFVHLYMPYYLYSYAIGISAAAVLSEKIIAGDTDTRDRYLNMLSLGSSKTVLDLYDGVGINPRTPDLVRGAFKVISKYLDIMEEYAP